MDIARRDQIVADVEQMTRAGLQSRTADFSLAKSDPVVSDCLDVVARHSIVEGLLRHHEALWPFSTRLGDRRELVFGGVTFAIATGVNVWEPTTLEIAYIPEPSAERVESHFGLDYALNGTSRYAAVRLYPPRAAIAFEFQQDVIIDIVRAVFGVTNDLAG